MKRYRYNKEFSGELYGGTIYIGTAREIKSLWNNFTRREIYEPSHCTEPVMKSGRMYGLDCGEYGEGEGTMYVLSASTVLELMEVTA